VSGWPVVGPRVPHRGNALVSWIGRAALRLLRWRVSGNIPDLPKFVIAVAPHTSNWDFVIGMAAMFALDLRLSFIGKHTLFVGPFAPILRWMGGIPVDRSSPHGIVEQSVRAFAEAPDRILALAPQGTRKPVAHFKSGFLHIARGAGVPVVLATLDYAERCVRIGPRLDPGPDIDAELAKIEAMFDGVRGRHPRVASPV